MVSMSQGDNTNNFPTLWFEKTEFSTLMGLYAQSVSCNIFKDYSIEYSPSGNWQRFHFKKHHEADSDIYVQIDRFGTKKTYSVYDNLCGIKKRSSNLSGIISYIRDGLKKRAPALKRSIFSENGNSPSFYVVDN